MVLLVQYDIVKKEEWQRRKDTQACLEKGGKIEKREWEENLNLWTEWCIFEMGGTTVAFKIRGGGR